MPVPAVGSTLGGAINVYIPPWDPAWCMEEIAHCRANPAWLHLLAWVTKNLSTSARWALAVHTTSACQPQKATGPSGSSLKECGLETLHPAVGGGGQDVFVRLAMPHAYLYGDGFSIEYVSQPLAANKVRNAVCVEVLSYLTVSAPGRVRLHPSNWCQGLQTIAEFRARAIQFGTATGFTHRSLAWQMQEFHAGQPLAAMGFPELPETQPTTGSVGGPPGAGRMDDDDAVLDVLRGLRCDKEYLTSNSKMPTAIGKQLGDLLPKGGLLTFLQRYPNYFEVTLTGESNRQKKPLYTFKMKATINEGTATTAPPAIEAEPAVSGGSGTSGPAVGGSMASGHSPPWPSSAVRAKGLVPLEESGSGSGSSMHRTVPLPAVAAEAPAVAAASAVVSKPASFYPPGLFPNVGTAHEASDLAKTPPAVGGAAPGFDTGPAVEATVGDVTRVVPTGPVELWTTQHMAQYLHAIDLGHLAPAFMYNGVDGRFLLQCSNDDLRSIGVGPVQAKKITSYLPKRSACQPLAATWHDGTMGRQRDACGRTV